MDWSAIIAQIPVIVLAGWFLIKIWDRMCILQENFLSSLDKRDAAFMISLDKRDVAFDIRNRSVIESLEKVNANVMTLNAHLGMSDLRADDRARDAREDARDARDARDAAKT